MQTSKTKDEVVQEYRIASIQDATMRVIARKGMAAATMQEIADEAGVAKGTIYLYFRDRDELVEKTFQSAITRLMTTIDAAIEQDMPLESKIRAIMRAHLQFFSENREFFRLYLSMRMPEGPVARQRRQQQECQPQYRSRVQRLADALTIAMDRGEIRRVDAYKLALFIIEGSTAIILDRLSDEASTYDEADVDLITGLILDGVRERR
ncbi:MAG TPA: TetR/AcrR family transcriptional regulator [Thermoanaerobaculia bacterium]|jgi:AcrR family transcriptional regulator